MPHGVLSELVVLIDLVDVKIAGAALLELTTARRDQMRLEVCTLLRLVRLAVREYAVLDHHIGTVLEEVVFALPQRIGHVAHVAVYLDLVELILNHTLHFHCT